MKQAPVVAVMLMAALVLSEPTFPFWVLVVICAVAILIVIGYALADNWISYENAQSVVQLKDKDIAIQNFDGEFITEVLPVTHHGVRGWAVHGDVDKGFYPDSNVTIWLSLE